MFRRLPIVGILTVFALAAVPAWAQSTSAGSVNGQITDQQNAAIVGAEVKLADVETSTVRTTVSNETGRYSFINVAPGTYDITVSKPGFTQAKIAGHRVEVGRAVTANVSL